MNFFRISRQIPENSDVCRFFNQICENKSEICRKFWILWKKFTIFQKYSLHSLGTAPKDKDLEAKLAQAQASVEAQTREVARLEATLQERDVIIAVHLTPGGVRGRQAGQTYSVRSRLYRRRILQLRPHLKNPTEITNLDV